MPDGPRVPIHMTRPLKPLDSRLRWIVIAGLALNALWCCWMIIDSSRTAVGYHPYRYHRLGSPADWAFPTEAVAKWISGIAVEVLVMSLILRHSRLGTSVLCFLLSIPTGVLCVFSALFSMHAPRAFSFHTVMLFFAAAWMLVMTVISGIVWLRTRRERAEELEVVEPPRARVVRG
jgi:hypothetical protein